MQLLGARGTPNLAYLGAVGSGSWEYQYPTLSNQGNRSGGSNCTLKSLFFPVAQEVHPNILCLIKYSAI